MKNDAFNKAIEVHLKEVCEQDENFKQKFEKAVAEGKTVETCCNFIISEVRKAGKTAMTDAEVYGIAVHYYDETAIAAATNKENCTVVAPAAEEQATGTDDEEKKWNCKVPVNDEMKEALRMIKEWKEEKRVIRELRERRKAEKKAEKERKEAEIEAAKQMTLDLFAE